MRFGQTLDLVEIDTSILGPDTVGECFEPFARKVRSRAMGQVPARRKRHSEDRVARCQQRQEHRLVRLCPGMRLDIGEGASEKPLGAVDRERFGDIDEFASAVIAATGVALGVFVGQH